MGPARQQGGLGLKTMDVIAARLLQQGRGGLSPVAGMKTHSSGPSSKPRFTRAVTDIIQPSQDPCESEQLS